MPPSTFDHTLTVARAAETLAAEGNTDLAAQLNAAWLAVAPLPPPDRDDGWILTQSGLKFDLFRPTPDMITIEDIAYALAHVARFGGHGAGGYTVAQHSVLVSRHVPADQALEALMHDSPEAYLGDVVRPLKRALPAYKLVEDGVWSTIQAKFELGALTPEIKQADERALMTERRDLMPPSPKPWVEDERQVEPFPSAILPWPAEEARQRFLVRFRDLVMARDAVSLPPTPALYEFGAMSSVWSFEASDPKVALVTSLLWCEMPLVVCYSHPELGPNRIIGGASLAGGSTLAALEAWLGCSMDDFMAAHGDEVGAASKTLQSCKIADRQPCAKVVA